MQQEQTWIIDVDEQNFQQEVVAKSMETPVVVDLWAPWCGPCKTLTPILENLANEFKGAFILAKVNVDTSPQLAMAFGAQSVPMVVMIKDGRPADAFQGAQPESTIRQFLGRFVRAPEQDPLEAGLSALSEKQYDQAAACFQSVLSDKPKNADALIGLAKVAIATKRFDEVPAIVDAIDGDDPQERPRSATSRGTCVCGGRRGSRTLMSRVAENDRDVEAWFKLGATHSVSQSFEDAFDAFLKVVALDRSYRDDIGRRRLLALFELVGAQDPAVLTARRKLAGLLF